MIVSVMASERFNFRLCYAIVVSIVMALLCATCDVQAKTGSPNPLNPDTAKNRRDQSFGTSGKTGATIFSTTEPGTGDNVIQVAPPERKEQQEQMEVRPFVVVPVK